MKLSEELLWRGFVNQTTFGNLSKLDEKKWTFYHGYDASADSQTIGNLAAMMLDRLFLRHGSNAVILAGGATSLIGDPGGKDKERPMQDEAAIAHNVEKAEEQLDRVLSGYEFKMVNNLDWFKNMNVLEFLRDVGKNFSMTPLVQRDYIASRMGEGGAGISYTEFSYTILQGYDFYHLNKEYGVDLQLAGSDQWGNCLSGIDLVRRLTGNEVNALTMPLIINKSTGKKFGKTEDGAIWLDANKTSVYKFYQFWLNVDDEGIGEYLKLFTELDRKTIDQIMTEFAQNKSSRIAQKKLAYEVTKLVHGQDQADKQTKIADAIVAQKIDKLGESEVSTIREEVPSIKTNPTANLVETIVKVGLASSYSEARQLIAGGAIYINGERSNRENIKPSDFLNGRLLLRRGKAYKDSALVELE